MIDPASPESKAPKRGSWGWLIAVMVAFVAIVVFVPGWLEQRIYSRVVPTASFGSTTDMTPISLHVDSHKERRLKFLVPKAYLPDRDNWGGGRQEYVRVLAHLASLQPFSVVSADAAQKSWEQAAQLEKGRLLLRITSSEPSHDYPVRRYEKTLKEYNDRLPDAYGLERYQKKVCLGYRYEGGEKKRYDCLVHHDQVFMSAPGASGTVWIRCHLVDRPVVGNCEGVAVYRGFQVDYLFSNTEIEHWKKFNAGANALLDALFQAEEKFEAVRVGR